MTPLDPRVPSAGDIWNTVTDYREICIAGVTLPKRGRREEVRGRRREGGEKDACSLVVLQHLQHLVSSFSHHRSLSDFCFYFWSPSFPQLSSLLPAAAFGLVQQKQKSERCRCEWVTVCHWVHRDCREWSKNDDHQCSGYPIGAISCCHDQGLLLLCNALQCNINPEGLSLAGLMKRLSRENIRLR